MADSRVKDIVGNKYGKLKVLNREPSKNKRSMWKCVCECGVETIVAGGDLASGHTKTCGIRKNHRKHPMNQTRIYQIWQNMKSRCNNPNFISYPYYGGRGIKYCEEWEEFKDFYDWAEKSGYSDELTIERIDFNDDYKPSNCRWATKKEQMNNTSANVRIEIDGVVKTLSQWSELSGISRNGIKRRYKAGIRGTDLLAPTAERYKRKKK